MANPLKKQATIRRRIGKQQKLLVEQLRKLPIVQLACERTGVARATYYRWRNDNPAFQRVVDEAMHEAEGLVSDMGESQLISLIREKNFSAIRYWLGHRSPRFKKPDAGPEADEHVTYNIVKY